MPSPLKSMLQLGHDLASARRGPGIQERFRSRTRAAAGKRSGARARIADT